MFQAYHFRKVVEAGTPSPLMKHDETFRTFFEGRPNLDDEPQM